MKSYLYIAVIAIMISPFVQAQSYKPGEKVTYTIQYGIITAGNATLNLDRDTLNGEIFWHTKLAARTTGMAEAFFKVLDIYESYIDTVTELPVKSIRNVREGRYRN